MGADLNLHTSYLGFDLLSPIVASAGPLTRDVDDLVALERAGAGAVVLPSLFEEQIEHDTAQIDRLLSTDRFRAPDPARAEVSVEDYNHGLDDYLVLIEGAKSRVDIPVIASLNGANIGGWLRYALLLQDAGADAVELNLFAVGADPIVSASTLESEQFGLVALLADELTIPLAVKISPFYSSLASFVLSLQEAGADGVTMFNRLLLPEVLAEIDPGSQEPVARLPLSTPADLQLPLWWTAMLREHVAMSIACSSGVHSGADVAKLLLAGADVAMTTSALLRNGPGFVAELETQLREWMDRNDIGSVADMRGLALPAPADDPAARERANYISSVASQTHRYLTER